MKRVTSYLFILIIGLQLFSCAKEEAVPEVSVSSPGTLVISADGTVQTVTVTTNQLSWSYATNQDWITVLKHGDVLSISASANTSVLSRSGRITITVGSTENLKTLTIEVNQSGAEPATLSISPNSLSLLSDSKFTTISITTNQPTWSYTANQEWITLSKTGEALTVSASSNLYPYTRDAIVTIIAGVGNNKAIATLAIAQQGVANATISVSTNVVELNSDGAAATVEITTNQSNWNFTAHQDWITVTKDGNVITISATPNGTSDVRTGSITIISGTSYNQVSVTINVNQAKKADGIGAGAGSGEFKELFD